MSSSWTLFNEGRRKPPKRSISRIIWGAVVLLVSASLLPFIVMGIIESAARGRSVDVVALVTVGILLSAGVIAPIVDWTRSRGRNSV